MNFALGSVLSLALLSQPTLAANSFTSAELNKKALAALVQKASSIQLGGDAADGDSVGNIVAAALVSPGKGIRKSVRFACTGDNDQQTYSCALSISYRSRGGTGEVWLLFSGKMEHDSGGLEILSVDKADLTKGT